MKSSRYVLVLTAILAGCVGSGPRTNSIMNDEDAIVVQTEKETPFVVLSINGPSAKLATDWMERSRATSFIADAGASAVVIGPGDILDISIVTTSESGFIDMTNSTLSPISTTSLPQQEVGSDGMVSIPPIGRIKARGRSAQALENMLARRLGEVLVEPSIIVRIAERRSARVSVLGAVEEPGTYTINQTNMRLVEMIALAGGPEEDSRSENLRVSYSRRGQTGRAPLNRIYENPSLNILVQPGDVISIEPPQTRLTVLGAGGQNTTLKYDEPQLSLADALGRGGGLINRRADRKGVFIYREVSIEAAKSFGVDVSMFDGPLVPTIFNLDMSQPQSLFAAKDFYMAEDDIIYISDSVNEEIQSVYDIIRPVYPTGNAILIDAAVSN